jgi:glucose-1-phosphate adenylyltransferase
MAIILAGGQGSRLSILAHERAKPAIPFAGKYRIIDFTLSNCVNSGIHNVAVLTQYEPRSLSDHIGTGTPWRLDHPGGVVRLLQPYLARRGRDWYKGTADAVYQNLHYIEEQGAEQVLILSGDHIYKMDYADMLRFHGESEADVTLAVCNMAEREVRRFGTVMVDEKGQVIDFEEKVKKPKSNLASMGIYLFKKDVLQRLLEEDAHSITSKHDFGKNVLPGMLSKDRVFAYRFDGYWQDVGTVQAYWEASLESLEWFPRLLFDPDWPVRTREEERPPAIIAETAEAVDSLISSACVIEGRVQHSVLSPGVKVAKGAVIKDSIIMSDSIVGRDSVIDRSILDKEVSVEADCHIGFGEDFQVNHKEPKTLNTGITIVGKKAGIPAGVRVGRNCIVYGGVTEGDFPGLEIQSGETIEPKGRRPARKV